MKTVYRMAAARPTKSGCLLVGLGGQRLGKDSRPCDAQSETQHQARRFECDLGRHLGTARSPFDERDRDLGERQTCLVAGVVHLDLECVPVRQQVVEVEADEG